MKSIVIKFLIGLLIFTTSFLISAFTLVFDYAKESWGLGALIGFLLFLLTTALYLRFFKNTIGIPAIIILSIIAMLTMTLGMAPSFRFILKTGPSIIALTIGIFAGYLFDNFKDKRKLIYPCILLTIPILLNLNIYSLWIHKVEFGTFYGDVTEKKIVQFEFTDKTDKPITNESLIGSVVLFDFWFISCGPCWVKFPELERIYNKYKSNPLVKIYAINRPMSRDKPNELFSKIEEKAYTFPVLRGTQEGIDLFNVYKYPTVILLNQKGEISFMGTIENIEEKIDQLLKQ